MAVVYQNKSEVSVGTAQNTITIPVPTGFSAGDLLIACIVMDRNSYLYKHGTPTGWTLIQQTTGTGGTHCFSIWYRIAEAGDTQWTWTIGYSGTFQQYGVILRYTGQAETGFIHASDMTVQETANTTPTAPSVAYTDLEAGSLCLQAFGADDDDTPYTTPAQLTQRYNGISNTGTGTCGSAGGDKAVSGTGSTGTAQFTMNASEEWTAITVVIEAAPGAIVKTFEDTFTGTDSFLSDKNLIFLDNFEGIDSWVLPEIIRKIFSDTFTGIDNFLKDWTAKFEDTFEGVDVFKVDKTVVFSDTLTGTDVFLVDKEAKFEDILTVIEKFYASYPYPKDLKRKIIIIRDLK